MKGSGPKIQPPRRYRPREHDVRVSRAAEARMMPVVLALHDGVPLPVACEAHGVTLSAGRRFLEARALYIRDVRECERGKLRDLIRLVKAPPATVLPLGRLPQRKEIAALSHVSRGGRLPNTASMTGLTLAEIKALCKAVGGVEKVQARAWNTLEAEAVLMGQVK